MTEYSKLDAPEKYLDESGLLFHINRAILHPLGLSLMVSVEESPSGDRTTVLDLYETDNPLGFVMDEDVLERRKQIYETFLAQKKPQVLQRAKGLGFIIQGME